MMLATPVRSSAWSSTMRTLAGITATETTSGMRRTWNGERRRLPGEYDLGALARCRDDCQRGADALGTLLHAGHTEAAILPIARDAAAIVGHRQPEPSGAHRRRLH